MMVRGAVLLMAFSWASPGLSQQDIGPSFSSPSSDLRLQLGYRNFGLPVIEYRAPDGTWKRGHGIIVGHDISPNASVGLGFFKMTPKNQDKIVLSPAGGKSKKMSLGFSLRF
jgi:hypothetical protein